MPNNIKIIGNDVPWKREVDTVIRQLQNEIDRLRKRISYLESRVK